MCLLKIINSQKLIIEEQVNSYFAIGAVPGLPDGIQKFRFGYILEGLGIENDGLFYMWPLGIFYGC
jgi:hypothetical protein